jgi:hypothetical protein
LTPQDGVWVKSGALTRRYLGTIRTTDAQAGGQCEDSESRRFVWNYYNRLPRKLKVIDTTDWWAYGTGAWRAARNTLANRVQLVIGVSEHPVTARCLSRMTGGAGGFYGDGSVGIGVDSITSNSADLFTGTRWQISPYNHGVAPTMAEYFGYPGYGYHFLQWIEHGAGGAGTAFYGDGGLAYLQAGLKAEVWG